MLRPVNLDHIIIITDNYSLCLACQMSSVTTKKMYWLNMHDKVSRRSLNLLV